MELQLSAYLLKVIQVCISEQPLSPLQAPILVRGQLEVLNSGAWVNRPGYQRGQLALVQTGVSLLSAS